MSARSWCARAAMEVQAVKALARGAFDRYRAALQYRHLLDLWLANVCAQAAAWGLIVARGWPMIGDSAASLLLWEGLIFTAIILVSPLVVTGRRVYGRDTPVEAPVQPV